MEKKVVREEDVEEDNRLKNVDADEQKEKDEKREEGEGRKRGR